MSVSLSTVRAALFSPFSASSTTIFVLNTDQPDLQTPSRGDRFILVHIDHTAFLTAALISQLVAEPSPSVRSRYLVRSCFYSQQC